MAKRNDTDRQSGNDLACGAPKRTPWYVALGLAMVLLGTIPAMPAHAQGGASSAGEAAEMVKSNSGARVLGVRTQNQGQRIVYRVKILTARGVVRVVTVPHRGR